MEEERDPMMSELDEEEDLEGGMGNVPDDLGDEEEDLGDEEE